MNQHIRDAVRHNADIFELLRRLTIERAGWRRYVLGRWRYTDEPLRADAVRILRERDMTFLVEKGCISAAGSCVSTPPSASRNRSTDDGTQDH